MHGIKIWFQLMPFITFLLLGALWFSYYYNRINGFVYIGILLFALLIASIFLIVFRKNKNFIGKIIVVSIILILLIMFDFKLLHYEANSFTVSFYAEPIEVIDGSGIHLMVVETFDVVHVEDKEFLKKSLETEDKQIISIYEVDNKSRYLSKNIELLQMIGFEKDHFEVMNRNVKEYLSDDMGTINDFVSKRVIIGDSAGLGLALSGLLEQKKLSNKLPIGVTGALSPTGDVTTIGMIKEKMIIAEQKNLPYMIIPEQNANEANNVIRDHQLSVEIFPISHIDQAIQVINTLNNRE